MNNKTKSWLFEKKNKIDKPLAKLSKKKGRCLKSIKLEMKRKRLQLTPQKNEEAKEITKNKYMSIKQTTQKK